VDDLARHYVRIARRQEYIRWSGFSRLASAAVERLSNAKAFHVVGGAGPGLERSHNGSGGDGVDANTFRCELSGKAASECHDCAFGRAVVDCRCGELELV
jgi:hypothetical protein